MQLTFILVVIFLTFNSFISAQQNLPIIKANSVYVTVKDGDVSFNEEWIIGDGTQADPEIYVPIKSKENKKITFVTGVDSISFDTVPNGKYSFIVEYKNTRIFTQIDRSEKLTPTLLKGITFSKKCKDCPNIIPFTINPKNNGILIKGRINDSEILDFAYDTGAKWVYFSNSIATKKADFTLDGTIKDVGGDGVTKLPTSSGNRLSIGEMEWKNVELSLLNFGDEDAIIGWSIFESTPIEIDYDKKILTIHQSPATIPKDFTKHKMEIFSGSPFIEATITIDNKEITDWFLFDSGFNGSLHLSNRLAVKNNLIGTMQQIGKGISTGSGGGTKKLQIVSVPKIRIGNHEIKNIKSSVNAAQADDVPHDNVLGNELLKGFNVVLDFKNQAIYLKPNSLFQK